MSCVKRVRKRLLQTRSKIELRYFSISYTLLATLLNHIYSSLMTAASDIFCIKPCIYDCSRQLASNDSCTDCNDVCIVVFFCEFCEILLPAQLPGLRARTPFYFVGEFRWRYRLPVPQIKTPASILLHRLQQHYLLLPP